LTESYTCKDDTECWYLQSWVKDAKATNKLNNVCDCSFNQKWERFCKMWNWDVSQEKFVSSWKKVLSEKFCHTEERFSCSWVRANSKTHLKELGNSTVDVLNSHKFQWVDKTIKRIVFPLYNDGSQVCPKFVCEDKKDWVCVNTPAGDLNDQKKVTLRPCDIKQTC